MADRCIGCGKCVEACPEDAICTSDGIQIDRKKCTRCGVCAEICPAKAIKTLRSDWSVDDLFNTINRDRAFLTNGGGVTVSGGEPALQWPFVSALLERCQMEGLHTALDTCGAAPSVAFDAMLPHCDLILFDLKIMNPSTHKKWTGQDNTQTLKNLRAIAEHAGNKLKIWIRTPLIPNATANTENIAAIASFIANEIPGAVERWEHCAFNSLCADKYHKLGSRWSMEKTPLITRDESEALLKTARSCSSLPPENIFLKGRLSQSSTGKKADCTG